MPLENVITPQNAYLMRGSNLDVDVPNADKKENSPIVRIFGKHIEQPNMASSKRKRKMARAKMRFMEKNHHEQMKNDKVQIHPKNPRQKLYMEYLDTKDLVFAHGFPGTAKTLIALYKAFQYLDDPKHPIDMIYVARPKVGVKGEKDLGALPGTLEEKTLPYLTAIKQNMLKFMSPGRVEQIMSERGKPDSCFEFLPFDFLRGQTLDNAFVIVDEAQNISIRTMFTILSRIGENSKYAINGDGAQRDLDLKHGTSGIEDAIRRFGHLDWVGHIEFLLEDVCRSKRAKQVINAYQDLYGYGK